MDLNNYNFIKQVLNPVLESLDQPSDLDVGKLLAQSKTKVVESAFDKIQQTLLSNDTISQGEILDTINQTVQEICFSKTNELIETIAETKHEYQSMGNSSGLSDWSWLAYYDYFLEIGILTEENAPLFVEYADLVYNSKIYDCLLYEELVIVCALPESLHFNDNGLHGDGFPAIQWKDGYKQYYLNGTNVPEYLAITPTEDLDIQYFLSEISNADVRIEFINKYGIEHMCELGEVVDTYENYSDEWYHKSEYQLLNMGGLFDQELNLFLKMKHQTMDMFCLEGVENDCKTITEALSYRAEVDMDEYEIIDIK